MDVLCAFMQPEMLSYCEEYEDVKKSRPQGFLSSKIGHNQNQCLKYKVGSLARHGDTFKRLRQRDCAFDTSTDCRLRDKGVGKRIIALSESAMRHLISSQSCSARNSVLTFCSLIVSSMR